MSAWKFDSPKYGRVEVLVDDQFDHLKDQYYWYIWGSARHKGLYVVGEIPGTKTSKRLHRVIMNAQPGDVVDHANGNPLDNRLDNLRITSSQNNNRNATKRKNSSSKYKGVSKHNRPGIWKMQININKDKYIFECPFYSEEEAALRYNELATKYFGPFAKLNKLP